MTTYLFHSTLLLSGLTLFYWYILRHETYFRLNRWVILGGVIFCLALPTISIPASMSLWSNTNTPTESILETITQAPGQLITPQSTPSTEYTNSGSASNVENNAIASTFSWSAILSILYIVGVVIFLLIFLVQVVILLTQRYNLNSFQTGKYTIVEMVKDSEPCSFLNYIYINPNKYDEETYNHIIEHEKAHIDQSHFVDKVIAEMLIVLFWFNPFTWLLRKSISQNLEFLTDKSLLDQGIQKDKYQMSLLKVSVSNRPLNLTASYNSSFLKSRIIMMNEKNSSVVSAWKYLFIVPLFVLSIASLNAVQNNDAKTSLSQSSPSDKSAISIPVSSGHISKELELPYINKIGMAMSGNIVLSQGAEQKITVTGPKELIDEISTVVTLQNWNVEYTTNGLRKNSNQVTIYAQLTDLTHLALSGSGRIMCSNRFKGIKDLYIALSGAGHIEFEGDAKFINTALSGTGNILIDSNSDKLNTALSGTGNISFIGQSNQADFVSSGSGNISANQLKAKKSRIVIDGASSITVDVEEFLEVIAGGSASISYKGNPKIKKDLKNESRLQQIH